MNTPLIILLYHIATKSCALLAYWIVSFYVHLFAFTWLKCRTDNPSALSGQVIGPGVSIADKHLGTQLQKLWFPIL